MNRPRLCMQLVAVIGILGLASSPPVWAQALPVEPASRLNTIGGRLSERLILLNDIRDQLDATVDDLDESDVAYESVDVILPQLQMQRIGLMIDLAGLDAREEELVRQAKEHDAAHQSVQDKVIAIAKQKVDFQRQKLEKTEAMIEKGMISTGEAVAAKADLLNAELQLEQLISETLRDSDDTSRRGLSEVALERAEKRARLEMVSMLLEKVAATRAKGRKASELSKNLSFINQDVETLKREFLDLSGEQEGRIEFDRNWAEEWLKAHRDAVPKDGADDQ